MPSTTTFALPYPDGDDSPDGPTQIGALAQEVEDTLVAGTGIRSYGKSIIAAEQTTTSTTYTLLGTPDRVQNIVLPTDGLIFVSFRALAAEGLGQGKAAIFLGNNQLKKPNSAGGGAAVVSEASLVGNSYQWLTSAPHGLVFITGSVAATGGITTGFAFGDQAGYGGVCAIEAAAGTYDVSVRFKASSGSTVYAGDRKLRVWSQAF